MTVPFFLVVFFSGRSWCSYFDTTDGYLRFIPDSQMTVSFFPSQFFSGDSWCLYFDTTDGYLRFIPTDSQTAVKMLRVLQMV
jgi:hypothetical protein